MLYSTTALLPLFLQSLMGYPAFNSGMAISPRGIGAVCALMVVGRLVGRIDTRMLITFGFAVLAYSCWWLGNLNLEIATRNVMWPNVISGLAMGFIFVPLTTATMGSLSNEQMGNGAGIFNLMRNIGGSVGISMATTMVARGTQSHQAQMVAHLTPYDFPYQQQLSAMVGARAPGRSGRCPPTGRAAVGRHPHAAGQSGGLCGYVSHLGGALSDLCSTGVSLSQDATPRRASCGALRG